MLTRTKLPVRAATVTRSDLKSTTATNGKVEPQVNFEAHAPFAGLVKALYVHEGDAVPANKLLLSMGDTEARARLATALAALRGAQASYQAAMKGGTQEERLSLGSDLTRTQAELDQAQRDFASLQKLQSTGAASANEVAAAKQRVENSKNSLQTLQQRKTSRYSEDDLAHAKATLQGAQEGYASAQATLNQANVRAPFAGTVYSLPVSKTEFVEQGGSLLQMADLSKLQVRAYFDEPEIGRLKVGQPITIEWDARPTQQWHGHIVRIPSTIITYGTRNVGAVLVAIDDSDGVLLPNTNVRVTVTVANDPNVLTIPREALHLEQGKSYVYKIVNGILRRTPVTTGDINLTVVEIKSGLNEGDVVALGTTNAQPLGNDLAVNVVR